MNQNSDNQPLDRLLRDWAKRHEPSTERLSTIQEQLRGRIDALEADAVAAPFAQSYSRQKIRWFGIGAGAGLAAGLLLALALGLANTKAPDAPHTLELAQAVPDEAQIDARHSAAKAELVAEFARLFSDRVAWVAETEDDVQFELSDAGNSESTMPSLEVRLVVMSREVGAANWTKRWALDVAARHEEPVYLDRATTRGQEGTASVWMLPMPDSRVYVETSLALSAPLALTTTVCGVQDPGKPVRILWLKTGDHEYEVYQTVAPLPAATASTGKPAKPEA